jgi:hypothetical protein
LEVHGVGEPNLGSHTENECGTSDGDNEGGSTVEEEFGHDVLLSEGFYLTWLPASQLQPFTLRSDSSSDRMPLENTQPRTARGINRKQHG